MPDSLFFNYFKDRLRFFLLWKKNAWWPVIKGISASLDQAREDILWVQKQYSPATCQEEFIELFAESRGIKRFPFEEKDQFKLRVVEAYDYWRSAGKTSTIREWLKKAKIADESEYAIIEFKDKENQAHLANLSWAEIYIQFENPYVDKQQRQNVQLIINDLKRASAKILTGFLLSRAVTMQYAVAKHTAARLKRTWQYQADRMSASHLKRFMRRTVSTQPKEGNPVAPVFDDAITQNGKTFVRTFDSDWCFDHKEDRPVKIRKSIK